MKIHGAAFVLVLLAQGANGRKLKSAPQKSARRKLKVMTPGPKLNALVPKRFPFAHHLNGFRRLEEEQERCDAAFTKCLSNEGCKECFDGMNEEDIDWANVDPYTPCDDIMNLLTKNDYCRAAGENQETKEMFCATFNGCVVWDEDDWDESSEDMLECSVLELCEWDGMHPSFVGDGICHDYECYNTEACGYDGGDCCEGSCSKGEDTCGTDGYYCRDPDDKDCDSTLSWECSSSEEEGEWEQTTSIEPEYLTCNPDEALIFVHKYDSWGDGWDDTYLRFTLDDKEIYAETLKDGKEGRDSVCLRQGCYQASANGGVWGNEVSWEVHTEMAGPPLAFGGAPSKCQFSVKGNYCHNTCNTMVVEEDLRKEDKDVTTYEQLQSCIADSCSIQFGLCLDDPACSPCLNDDNNSYCGTVGNFNSLVDCSMCHCLEDKPPFCEEHDGWRHDHYNGRGQHGPHGGRGSNKGGGREWHEGHGDHEGGWSTKSSNAGSCNPEQTRDGGNALLQYSECAQIDEVSMLITDWNENNFGPLDDFEACAHAFTNEKNHGGKQASDCMRLLASIPETRFDERSDISAIGEGVYKRGEDFCDCAQSANTKAPSCDSFIHFKVLLHETLDACMALDEIDCAAWSQFVTPCKDSMVSKFGSADFKNQEHCDYVEEGCGGAGVFPAFRRLDCGGEISKSAWDFYANYEKTCKKESSSTTSSYSKPSYSSPSSSSSSSSSSYNSPSSSNVATATYSNNGPPKEAPVSEPSETKKQEYVPYSKSELSADNGGHKKHHHVRNFFIVTGVLGVCFVVYKRRQAQNSFDYQRYRRQRNYQNDQGDLYNNLTGRNSGSSFEPPTLPPTPSEGFS